MSRINVVDEFGELVGWFDDDDITEFPEKTYFDGRNYISVPTRSQWDHQRLVRTAGGRWVIGHTSQWLHKPPRWEFVSEWEAKRWLLLNGHDDAYERFFGAIPAEHAPTD